MSKQERVAQRWGIDVGLRSVGFAGVRVTAQGIPVQLLNAQVWLHDGGVDPDHQKSRETRLAQSGIARRARRLFRTRAKRLRALDTFIREQGWPIVQLSKETNPYLPWEARARLAKERVEDRGERARLLSIALRHMARHRGWRSPYARVSSLKAEAAPSELFLSLVERVQQLAPHADETLTTAELVLLAGVQSRRMRTSVKMTSGNKTETKTGLLGTKLMQSDNVRELQKIFRMQRLPEALLDEVVELVFAAASPRGSIEGRVGGDALAAAAGIKASDRALRASLAFQRFRITSIVANLRIGRGDGRRPLTAQEMQKVVSFLTERFEKEEPSWEDVAKILDVGREALTGTGAETIDGEASYRTAPSMSTERTIRSSKLKPLVRFWEEASDQGKESLIDFVGNAVSKEQLGFSGDEVVSFLSSLSEEELVELDSIKLLPGRCAYSSETCKKLTEHMLAEGVDLQQARSEVFGVPADWVAPAAPIGEPVGNPSVDRVLKQVARWLRAMKAEFGEPEAINIEHVRQGFISDKKAFELQRERERREKKLLIEIERIKEKEGISGELRRTELRRHFALERQHSQCLYCGSKIDSSTMEMDHIVPRSGPGSTNQSSNLVAVCLDCNRSKAGRLFSDWVKDQTRDGISLKEAVERVKSWCQGPMETKADKLRLQNGVIRRLKQAHEDEPLDDRSIESVAWMARELRRRIEGEFPRTQVRAYRGELTAESRRASGIEKRIHFIGGAGKTRFDRRHHAIDAAVVAMQSPTIAKTLKQRIDLRMSDQLRSSETGDWKQFEGENEFLYQNWKQGMNVLSDLLNQAIQHDAIPVWRPLRLKVPGAAAHKAGLSKFDISKRLGDALSVKDIDRASSRALWCALTRHPAFDPKSGLPEDPLRTVSIHGRTMAGDEPLKLFDTSAPSVSVRGGFAKLEDIHHARIYRLNGKKPKYVMVRVYRHDLLKFSKEDVFSVNLPDYSVSFRGMATDIRHRIISGDAEYLGWMVSGDELLLDFERSRAGAGSSLLADLFPGQSRWHISGFEDSTRINARPALLAAEGLDNLPENSPWRSPEARQKVFSSNGLRLTVNTLFSGNEGRPSAFVAVVRRDSLGRERRFSESGLPVSWRLE